MPATPAPSPRQAPLCPLCGQPNACCVARSGSFDTPCWCSAIHFSPRVLALIPAAQRHQACLCRACAEAPDPAAAMAGTAATP